MKNGILILRIKPRQRRQQMQRVLANATHLVIREPRVNANVHNEIID